MPAPSLNACEHANRPSCPDGVYRLGDMWLCLRCMVHELAACETARINGKVGYMSRFRAEQTANEAQQARNDADSLAMLRRENRELREKLESVERAHHPAVIHDFDVT